ncbi:MAG: hypothetical protein ACOX69_09580 [Coriobacteriales bacterium]
MQREEAIEAYSKKFGGFPSFLVMGMSDDDLVELIEKSLETGKPISYDKDKIY